MEGVNGVVLWAAAEEERLKNYERIERRILRDNSQPMMLSEETFIDNFRLSKEAFRTLCNDLEPHLKITTRSSAVLPEIEILAALQFYASGGYQRGVGSNFKLGLAQQTVSDCLAEVTEALNKPEILRKYIRFPQTESERAEVAHTFYQKFGFPGVLGCIDGTHVAIIRPKDNEEAYFNRKFYHSLNVMLVCDANLRILYCDASYGGASHDAHVWNSSPLKLEMERLWAEGNSYWFLGDSGYAQRDCMMIPILGAAHNSPEEYYTNCHVRTRNVVERCFGVLKSRFRCLLAHRTLHYEPVKAGKLFNACAVLHNLINDPDFPIEREELELDHIRQPPIIPALNDADDTDRVRAEVVQRLWSGRAVR